MPQSRQHRRQALCASLALLCVAALAAKPAAAAPTYRFSPFNVPAALGNGTSAYAINDEGTIVGNFYTADANQYTDGLVYNSGTFSDVAVPSAGQAAGNLRGPLNGINQQGTAVGGYVDAKSITHAFARSSAGKITLLPDVAGATFTAAFGINDLGTVVGRTKDAAGVTRGYISSFLGTATYSYPGAKKTFFTGINDAGLIVGRYPDADGAFHSFLLNEWTGKVSSLDVPGAGDTFAQSINNLNQVAGYYDDGTATGTEHGFVLSNAVVTTVDYPGAVDTELLGLNDFGVLVGSYDFGGTDSFGLVATPSYLH